MSKNKNNGKGDGGNVTEPNKGATTENIETKSGATVAVTMLAVIDAPMTADMYQGIAKVVSRTEARAIEARTCLGAVRNMVGRVNACLADAGRPAYNLLSIDTNLWVDKQPAKSPKNPDKTFRRISGNGGSFIRVYFDGMEAAPTTSQRFSDAQAEILAQLRVLERACQSLRAYRADLDRAISAGDESAKLESSKVSTLTNEAGRVALDATAATLAS